MFGILESVTKAALGVVFSPVSVAADIITMGGALTDRDEPYTVSSLKAVMNNMNHAVDPDTLSRSELEEIVRELNRRR